MLATGLIFLLGALVAFLLALLFVPLLWRNAQRLARRDYAATMPATMSEIRSEVDRVRAESAMTVRRHEMIAQKARERLARERSSVGQLTTAQARMSFTADQHRAEANALRAQLASSEEKRQALEEECARLDRENRELQETLAEAAEEMRTLEDEAAASARLRIQQPSEDALDGTSAPTPPADLKDEPGREEPDATRIAAATSALLAFAREQRRGQPANSESSIESVRPESASSMTTRPADAAPSPAAEETPAASSGSGLRSGAGERQLVDELKALAAAPRPTNPEERERQNARIRNRIADVAARVIQLSGQSGEPNSPSAMLLHGDPDQTSGSDAPSLAERVRRLGRSRHADLALSPVLEPASDASAPVEAPEQEPSGDATLPNGAKRRRGGARSRQRSQR